MNKFKQLHHVGVPRSSVMDGTVTSVSTAAWSPTKLYHTDLTPRRLVPA